MENGQSPEYQPAAFEVPTNEIDMLHERLGFIETDELRGLRAQATEASVSGASEKLNALLREYQVRGEELVSSLDGDEYMHGQIGLIVAKATLHRDTGNLEAFLEHIRDAKNYAFNVYEDEAVSVLEKAPSIEIARILSGIGEEFGFDDETVAEIAAEPYEQAFETAYGYLMQAGLDADEILVAFVVDELSNKDT